jgi:hypothetical protein
MQIDIWGWGLLRQYSNGKDAELSHGDDLDGFRSSWRLDQHESLDRTQGLLEVLLEAPSLRICGGWSLNHLFKCVAAAAFQGSWGMDLQAEGYDGVVLSDLLNRIPFVIFG